MRKLLVLFVIIFTGCGQDYYSHHRRLAEIERDKREFELRANIQKKQIELQTKCPPVKVDCRCK